MADFGEDAVVSLGQYFWSSKEREVIKKGTKISREETTKHGLYLDHIIWKRDSYDIRQGSLDIVTAMGAFAGANFDSVSQLKNEV